jgi:hypothetical protein
MKETLQTIGNYQITSEKIDNCLPIWTEPSIALGLSGFTFFAFSALIMFTTPFFTVCITVCMAFLIFTVLPERYRGCGIRIELSGYNTNPRTTTFKFSNNPVKNVEKIKKTVDGYVNLANSLITEYKLQQKEILNHNEQCCTQYNDIIQKVKTE